MSSFNAAVDLLAPNLVPGRADRIAYVDDREQVSFAELEAAVVGHPDADDLIKPRAFVVPRHGHSASPELAASLQTFVKSRLAPYKYPRWIEFVDALPRTATGKLQRFRLRA
ncbi:MAG: hypothetical protein JNL82_28010 [Myxococcales bacterium]|nr:hypothetical protein [Myxococcales bacterium]